MKMNKIISIFFCFIPFLIFAQGDDKLKMFENEHLGYIVLNEETKEFYYTNNDGIVNTHMPIILNTTYSLGVYEELTASIYKLNSLLPPKVVDQINKPFDIQYERIADDYQYERGTYESNIIVDIDTKDGLLDDDYWQLDNRPMFYDVLLCADQSMSTNSERSDLFGCITLKEGRNELYLGYEDKRKFKFFTLKVFFNNSNASTRPYDSSRLFIETEKIAYLKKNNVHITIDTLYPFFSIQDMKNELLYFKTDTVIEFRGEEFVLTPNRSIIKDENNILRYYY